MKKTSYEICNALNIAICVLDEKEFFQKCNQVFSDMFLDETKLSDITLDLLFANDYSYASWYSDYFLKYRKGVHVTGQYTFKTKMQEEIWCKFSLQKKKDSKNTILTIENMSDYQSKLNEAQEKIEELQHTKEYYIQAAIEKNELIKTRDSLMLNQTKLAGMGEMIGAIAHQWKQPLAKINSIVLDIQTLFINSEKFEILAKKLDNIEDLTENMAETIEDFRNYINPTKQKEVFSFTSVLEETLKIFFSSAEKNNITIEKNFIDKFMIEGYKKDFIQSLLIFLKNSKDAFRMNNIPDGLIHITTQEIRNNKIIKIKDNGGGIDRTLLARIFEPYFSTKKHQGGTGLGLYMAKLLIEDGMKGKIKVDSINNTTEITIIFLNMVKNEKAI